MKIRLLTLASIAVLSLARTDALADDYHVSGFVGVNLGGTWSDFDSTRPGNTSHYGASGDAFVFSGQGRINAWLSRDMSVQLDATAEGTTTINQYDSNVNPGYNSDGRDNIIIGGHLSWRDPKSYLFGFFGGFSGASNINYDGTMSHAIVGVEGQYYSGPITLYGQAGFQPLMSDSDEYEPENVWFLRAVGRYFLNDDDRLQAELGYANADANGTTDNFDILTWGASWEHRYTGTPFSTGIQYNGFENERRSNWAQEHVVQVSFNIHFGENSLMAEDRDGATLDMPNFDRAFAWSYWTGR